MNDKANIIIADESALFFHLHVKGPEQSGAHPTYSNPLANCASKAADFETFNPNHPLYGGKPVSVLVSQPSARRQSKTLRSRCCPTELPVGSFLKLRDGLYLASPELVYARMANFASQVQLAEIGMNLCGRYYIDLNTRKIKDRIEPATTPERLQRFLINAPNLKGTRKALRALRWVMCNSGSPMETKMKLQFCNPLWSGGLGLCFTHMNYNVAAGRLARMTEQNDFCIDMVCLDERKTLQNRGKPSAATKLKTSMEYDGEDSHTDPGKDNRRRNALRAMGWEVFVIDKSVLYSPEKTIDAALQVARHMGVRIQFPKNWNEAFLQLRRDLELPV